MLPIKQKRCPRLEPGWQVTPQPKQLVPQHPMKLMPRQVTQPMPEPKPVWPHLPELVPLQLIMAQLLIKEPPLAMASPQ